MTDPTSPPHTSRALFEPPTAEVADAFVKMAHRIVWCTVATVDDDGRPRSRILHPVWVREGERLYGWIATEPTPVKTANLGHSPFVSCTYWSTDHDTCTADCRAVWAFDLETRIHVWDLFATTPGPVGYDPAMIPQWEDPSSEGFAVLRLEPYRLRVFPGTMLMTGQGEVHHWRA